MSLLAALGSEKTARGTSNFSLCPATTAAPSGSTRGAMRSKLLRCWRAKAAVKLLSLADLPFARAAAAGDRRASNLPDRKNAIMKLKALDPYTNRQATPLGVLRHDGAYDIVAEAHGHRNAETAALIEKAVNEHAALVAVAEAAQKIQDKYGKLPSYPFSGALDLAWKETMAALAALAAVRAGQQGSEVAK